MTYSYQIQQLADRILTNIDELQCRAAELKTLTDNFEEYITEEDCKKYTKKLNDKMNLQHFLDRKKIEKEINDDSRW